MLFAVYARPANLLLLADSEKEILDALDAKGWTKDGILPSGRLPHIQKLVPQEIGTLTNLGEIQPIMTPPSINDPDAGEYDRYEELEADSYPGPEPDWFYCEYRLDDNCEIQIPEDEVLDIHRMARACPNCFPAAVECLVLSAQCLAKLSNYFSSALSTTGLESQLYQSLILTTLNKLPQEVASTIFKYSQR